MWRLRDGDREAAAEFLLRYGSRIRRRIRGKLGPAVRRIFDSMDIMSTLGRRLNLYVLSGRINVTSEEQLWSLLHKITDHALVDKARLIRTMNSVETPDSEFTYEVTTRRRDLEASQTPGAALEIETCIQLVPQEQDRKLLSMWLMGESHEAIEESTGLNRPAVRKRMERIREYLREQFQRQPTSNDSGPQPEIRTFRTA